MMVPFPRRLCSERTGSSPTARAARVCAAMIVVLAVSASAALAASTHRYTSQVTRHHFVNGPVDGNPALHIVDPGAATVSAARAHGVFAPLVTSSLSGPIASAASDVNQPIPLFKMYFGYNVARGRLQLLHFTIKPYYRSFEALPSGGCVHCTGPGHLGVARIRGHVYTGTTVGKVYMDRRTAVVQAVTSPNRIGRLKVYGVNPDPRHAGPVLLLQSCTPANLRISNDEALDFAHLPTVPCTAAKARGEHLSINTPTEFSPTQSLQGTITGSVKGPQWLVVYQSDKYTPCAVNALAEALRTQNAFEREISGNFVDHFTTLPSTSPGYICAYVQRGPRLKVGRMGGNLTLPYGRVTVSASRPYLAGDTIAVTAPPSVTVGQTAQVTVNGTASVKEQIYVFATYGCAPTAQAEYGIDRNVVTATEAPGSYSAAVPVVFPATSPALSYICAYLQFGTPSAGGGPVGPLLTLAGAQVSVSGGASSSAAAVRSERVSRATAAPGLSGLIWTGKLTA